MMDTKCNKRLNTSVSSGNCTITIGGVKVVIWTIVSILSIVFICCSYHLHSLLHFQNNTTTTTTNSTYIYYNLLAKQHNNLQPDIPEREILRNSNIIVPTTTTKKTTTNNNLENKKQLSKKNTIIIPENKYTPPQPRGRGLSACLLVKDENNNLPEWIAYHYHTLPLRYLAIAIDPNSVTTPIEILQRWNNSMDMEIKLFDDTDLFPKAPKLTTNTSEIIKYHRKRQRRFIATCLRYHHSNNRSWTMVIDADEYLSFNPVTDYDIEKNNNHKLYSNHLNNNNHNNNNPKEEYQAIDSISTEQYRTIMQKFGFAIPIPNNPQQKQKLDLRLKQLSKIFLQKLKSRIRVPNNIRSQTISEYIHEEEQLKQNLLSPWNTKSKSCIVLPRVTFGNIPESSITDLTKIYQEKYPIQGLDPFKFNTLQFFHNSYKGLRDKIDSPGKSIVDVSRLSKYTLSRNMSRCVHTIVDECGSGEMTAYVMLEESVLKIHHYAMARDVHFAKKDPRRTTERYEIRANANETIDYILQPWLNDFIQSVGYKKARELLKGVGEIDDLSHS